MGLEATIERMANERAVRNGWIHRKLKWIGRRNAPDDFYAKAGRIVIVEYKSPDESPRIGQSREINELRDAGVEVHVIDRLKDAYALFDS